MTYGGPNDEQPALGEPHHGNQPPPQYAQQPPQYGQQPPQYGQSPYGYAPPPAPGYGYPQQKQGNGLATAGMVCGIVGLIILPPILGILALVFGGIGLSRANQGAPNKGFAIAAVVLGALDMIEFVVLLVYYSNHGLMVG